MNELRIAIIDPVGKKAGLDIYDTSLARVLIERSCKVSVISNFAGTKEEGFIKNHFGFTFSTGYFSLLKLIRKFNSALKEAKRENFKIAILHLFHSSFIDYSFIKLAKYFGFKICVIVHDVESLINHNRMSWIRKCIHSSDFAVVHNIICFDELIKKVNATDRNKISVIPHGNYIDSFTEASRDRSAEYFNLDKDKSFILFFGMIKKSKGLDLLIEALKNVSPDVDLIVAGRVRDISAVHFEKLIESLELSDRIHLFNHYISNEERSLLFSLADIVILPYRKIFQSGVLLQAMSYGKPVIASDLPANKLIIDGENGILFKTEDKNDLALKINILIRDKIKMKSVSNQAKKYVETNHDWKKIGDAFINVLEK